MSSGSDGTQRVFVRRTPQASRWPGILGAPLRLLMLVLAVWAGSGSAAERAETVPAPAHQPVVEQLIRLLEARPDLRSGLEEWISRAGLPRLASLDDFLASCDERLTKRLAPVPAADSNGPG